MSSANRSLTRLCNFLKLEEEINQVKFSIKFFAEFCVCRISSTEKICLPLMAALATPEHLYIIRDCRPTPKKAIQNESARRWPGMLSFCLAAGCASTTKGGLKMNTSAKVRLTAIISKAIGIVSALALCSAIVVGQHYNQTNLVSDIPNLATKTNPNLVNPWGLARSPGSPWWVADNGTAVSTLYDG